MYLANRIVHRQIALASPCTYSGIVAIFLCSGRSCGSMGEDLSRIVGPLVVVVVVVAVVVVVVVVVVVPQTLNPEPQTLNP